jgi:hypothetical protein
MGNLDFSNEPGFSWYCVLLLLSGVAMLAMVGVPTQRKGSRIANLIFGVGFVCYALYLILFFQGGTYLMFYKAFILPVFLIIGTIKGAADKRRAKNAAPYTPPVMNYGPAGQQAPQESPWAAQIQQPGAAPAAGPVAPFAEQPAMPLTAETQQG